jgi:hypothetical protein
MVTNPQKRTLRTQGKAPPLHEWSATIWHTIRSGEEWRKAETREGKFSRWQFARAWVIEQIKLTPYVYYAEVAHVERGKRNRHEDVAVIKFTPIIGGNWAERQKKKPWFEGAYH